MHQNNIVTFNHRCCNFTSPYKYLFIFQDKMPICAVQGCGNGEYGLKKWKMNDCLHQVGFKHGSGRCDCPPPFVLFTFPTEQKDQNRRHKWIQLINRKDHATGKNWVPKKHSRICSHHFKDSQPSAEYPDPILHMGYHIPKITSTRKFPTVRPFVTNKRNKEILEEEDVQDNLIPIENPQLQEDHDYANEPIDCVQCTNLMEQLKLCQKGKEELQIKVDDLLTQGHKKHSQTNRFISSNRKVKLNTGFPNRVTFDALYQHLSVNVKKMRYWAGSKKHTITKVPRKFCSSPNKFGPNRKLRGKEEFLLVLMKLRLGLTNVFLCDLFSISVGTCSQILNTWIRFLATELRPLVFWPERDAVRKMLPGELGAKYPRLRCTLDCTEIFIERPRHLGLQVDTWSDYKRHNTAKYLVAIAPNGMISFLSDGWGGRVSDKHIVNESGFLNLIDPGDVILADRGFTIHSELLMRQAKLEIPPPSSGWDQQVAIDITKTKKIANARIHVERAIGRLKWFAILKNIVPITLVPILDDIVLVCAALCNLCPPLVGR